MTSQDPQQPISSDPVAKPKWHKRVPSMRRFFIWNLFCWFFGASALVGGIIYTEQVVKPIADAGGKSYNPTTLFTEENSAQRVFGTNDRLNVLVLGIDYNHDEKGIIYTTGARSDTMMVMSLSREGKFLNIVSIPRDTKVFLGEGYGYDKINSAYSYGGVEQAKKVVSSFLGVPIHHHIVVKVTGAKKLVDAMGGLPIDVEKDMDYDDNWGNLHIHLKQGPQVLNGEQAVGYARFRHDEESDRGRIRRQQQVIKALGSKLKEPSLVTRYPEMAEVVKQTLETSFKPLEMVDLANLYNGFDFKNMRSAAIVGDDAMDSNGVSYIEPYAPENDRIVRRLLKSLDWVTKGDLRIRIYFKNASSDIAYRLADRLADSGFDGVQVDQLPADDRRDTKSTYLVWYNKVSRLEGILRTVTGSLPEREGKQPTGHDDDLAIIVGDGEKGEWAELPEHLKQPRIPATYRDDRGYNGDFVPRQLPPSTQSLDAPYTPSTEEPVYQDEAVDVTEQDYPTAPSSEAEQNYDPALEADPVPLEDPAPVEAKPVEIPPAPVEVAPPAPAPAPEPAPVSAPAPAPEAPPAPAPVPMPAGGGN